MNVILTDNFKFEAKPLLKKYHSLINELEGLVNSLIVDPKQGEPLGKDCYKIRRAIRSKGKGKSGGARIITYVKIIDGNVYLLTIYDKSEKETISNKELKELLSLIP